MRVLCLHPSTSSASQLHTSLSTLEERLWTKHGIELVFIDAPLLDVRLGGAVGVPDGGLTALHSDEEDGEVEVENSSRRWYVEEEVGLDGKKRSAVLPSAADDDSVGTVTNKQPKVNTNDTNHTTNKSTTVQYSGLDASLLHLSQIWSRGGANHNHNADNNNNGSGGIEQCLPFQGIMGIQQGANVAAMLPLLNTANVVYENEEEEGGKENWKSIFEGLQFVILVDGVDIMSQDEQQKEGEEDEGKDDMDKECDNHAGNYEEEGEDWYVGPNGISSLHVIAETTSKDGNAAAVRTNKSKSELLAKRYGPNATIQYYKPTKANISSSSSQSNTTKNTTNITQQQYNHLNSPFLHNILGKYLVHQKNTLHTNPQKRKLLQLQHQLCHVEQLASVMITEEVRRNPPKCLMAMIGPAAASSASSEGDSCEKENGEDETADDANSKKNEESTATNENVKAVVGKTVGAWQGPGRVPGEQGGGAPCPETFLLRQKERRRNNGLVVSHDVIVADET